MTNLPIARPGILVPLLVLAWCGHFLVDVMLGIWPVYKSLAQVDLAAAGLIVAGGAFIGEGSQLLFGSLSDKGYRHLLIILGILMAVGTSILPYATSLGILFLLYLMTSIGSGCFHPCAASLVNSLAPSKRNLMMTLFASGGSLGLASSQLIFTHSYQAFNGQTIWLAVPLVILALLLLFFWPASQKYNVVSVCQKPKWNDYVSFFRKPALRSLYLSQVANQSIYWGTVFILPDALKALDHPDWICYGMGHFCFILGGAIMMIPGGYFADKYSARTLMLIMGVTGSIAFYLLLFFGSVSLVVALPVLFVLGSSLAILNPLAVALGVKLEPEHPGAVSAFLMGLVWCVSEAIGPGGVGILTKLFDDFAPVKALSILGLLFLVQIYHTLVLPQESELVPVQQEI